MKSLFLILILIIAVQDYHFASQIQPIPRQNSNTKGPEPDYSKLSYWAASPYKRDPADSLPDFLKTEKRDSSVDVFFIHPTTFINVSASAWNASLDDQKINKRTNERPILYKASVFNGSCRIFAPRYRQANLKAFFKLGTPLANNAFDIAYSDIKKAFEYYLQFENKGRPIIIASHSQGTLHGIHLLKEFFDGKPLQKQLVCAYLIGYQIEKNVFKNIPLGDSAKATGCFVGWRSFKKGFIGKRVKEEMGNSVCVNPLNWRTTSDWVRPAQDIVAVKAFKQQQANNISAAIEPKAGILWVDGLNRKTRRWKNLHIFDYSLFWMNIRLNVKDRIEAYKERNK